MLRQPDFSTLSIVLMEMFSLTFCEDSTPPCGSEAAPSASSSWRRSNAAQQGRSSVSMPPEMGHHANPWRRRFQAPEGNQMSLSRDAIHRYTIIPRSRLVYMKVSLYNIRGLARSQVRPAALPSITPCRQGRHRSSIRTLDTRQSRRARSNCRAKWLHTFAWIVEAQLPVEGVNLPHIIRVQLEIACQIGLDAAAILALREHGSSATR